MCETSDPIELKDLPKVDEENKGQEAQEENKQEENKQEEVKLEEEKEEEQGHTPLSVFLSVMSGFSEVKDGVIEVFKAATEEVPKAFRLAFSDAAEIKDTVLFYMKKDEQGNRRRVEVHLKDIFTDIMTNLGIADGKNPKCPASDEKIEKLMETKLHPDDYTHNPEGREDEPPT